MQHTLSSFRLSARSIFTKYSLPRWMVFLVDGTFVFVAFVFAYLLRFNFITDAIDLGKVMMQSMTVLVVYWLFELLYRSYAGLIRHTTVNDIFSVLISTFSSLIALVLLVFLGRNLGDFAFMDIPMSILVIHFIAVSAFQLFLRILIKMFYELVSAKKVNKKNVVIYGAGAMGVIIKRVILSDTSNQYNIVAFLDNSRKLQNKKLSGIPVYSPNKMKNGFLDKHGIKSMIFAIRDIDPLEKSKILNFALDKGLEVLEIPGVEKWLSGDINIDSIKKIRLEDLLGREPIQLNLNRIGKGLRGKSILVTGAAGSIGSEIVRQLTRFEVRKIILVDNAETPMFHLKSELQEFFPDADTQSIIADATDQIKMERIFHDHSPDIIFHAAAYKHVPLMEENPHEAIRVNVGSTLLLSRLAQNFRVQKFVLVSTDKAVNPTNVMGASKRMCEMIIQARSIVPGNRVQFVMTRFGNVLGSNGSVIPIFQKQISEGGPITVTHPEIIRYFMTIPEACQLVLEAGFMGMGGEIFVFDMGNPVKIADLARKMIRLSGYEPDKDIQIEYTGLRQGEKLYEELLTDHEKTMPTYNPQVKVAEVAWLNHAKVLSMVHELFYTFPSLSNRELVGRLMNIVPEFKSTNEFYKNLKDDQEALELEVYPD